MSLLERLHNLIHQEQYHHPPSHEELKNGGIVGGTLQEGQDTRVQHDPRPLDLQEQADLSYPPPQLRAMQRRRSRRITRDGRR